MSIDLLHVLYLQDKICHAELEEANNNKKKSVYILFYILNLIGNNDN